MGWLVLVACGVLAYQRASLSVWTVALSLLLVFITAMHGWSLLYGLIWGWFLLVFAVLNIGTWRRHLVSKLLLRWYRRVMPSISPTEQAAIEAGTVGFEGALLQGHPCWQTLFTLPWPTLTAEEQAFLTGPVVTLCRMIDDWAITHELADLPQALWDFIKLHGFWGLIIPKTYGGKEFSAYAHSQILVKISAHSPTVATIVAVPNSLGPAELLLHYGTAEQKKYYLPRLAKGEDIPCFALTSQEAGSDASAMTDYGIVCYLPSKVGEAQQVGIRLNWNKRYITLAPLATVIGLAFKLYDPDAILGKQKEIGITLALIPRHTPGVCIGRRHYPLHTPFQNGPIQGKDVLIPLDSIIGGVQQAGKGWRMLMECLAAGRAISLPANAVGGAKAMAYMTSAYARIRQQFHVPIGYFAGVAHPLAQLVVDTYVADAARLAAIARLMQGHRDAVASAIVKYHTTELARQIVLRAMDIHGGKALCLGPKNYLAAHFHAAPIGITVEGANILTRNMIIFGQGLLRCHPYLLMEWRAAELIDQPVAIQQFDRAIFAHMGLVISNAVRSLILALSSSYLAGTPATSGKLKRYLQHATRFSSALAVLAEVAVIFLGGRLKRLENLSARLADILSELYLLAAVLQRYHAAGEPESDWPIVALACDLHCYRIQQAIDAWCHNFPNRWLGKLARWLIFPLGQWFKLPQDSAYHAVATVISLS